MRGKAPKSLSAAAVGAAAPAEPYVIPLYTERDLQRVAGVGETSDLSKEAYRSAFRRDYARLIHCPAFRRLQGKAQLFPCHENDFFRNRLTHSLEVAQIAKSIAIRLNDINPYFRKHNINTDLVEFAGLAHDIGHPPFGHNGEAELDSAMLEFGGFEGNAQTLRVISKLEKKQTISYPHEVDVPEPIGGSSDNRVGLNLAYRTMASVLKYDHQIPRNAEARKRDGTDKKPDKGYYHAEVELVRVIKEHVVDSAYTGEFKTIECSIMDIADDIAYSTYDLEDAFKGGFLTPLKILAMPTAFKSGIVEKIGARIDKTYKSLSLEDRAFTIEDYDATLRRIFAGVLKIDLPEGVMDLEKYNAIVIDVTTGTSENICGNGYYRTEFTSELVGRFVRAVDVDGR
jgi:dGTPase